MLLLYRRTELSYVIRKKDFCEFHHVFRRDRESNQARTDRMSRKVRLFVCYARSMYTQVTYEYNVSLCQCVNVSKHEHRSKLLYNWCKQISQSRTFRFSIKVMCSCKNEIHLANYHKHKYAN